MRRHISEIPQSHVEMDSSFQAVTDLGSEVDVKVDMTSKEMTSNDRALMMMSMRIQAASDARRRGLPLGRDLGVRMPSDDAAVAIRVTVSTATGFDCSYNVACDSMGKYVSDGSSSYSLGHLVERLADRVERQAGVAFAAEGEGVRQPRY